MLGVCIRGFDALVDEHTSRRSAWCGLLAGFSQTKGGGDNNGNPVLRAPW